MFEGEKAPLPLVDQMPLPVEEVAEMMAVSLFAQTVWLEEAVTTAGELITTFSVPTALVHPFTVIVSEYVPASAVVTLLIVLFCEEELYPFGPVQEYVAPAVAETVSDKFEPTQSGLLLFGFGVAGVVFTTTVTVAGALEQPLLTTTVYVPAAAVVTFGIAGFCCVELNEFGPVHV